MIDPFLILTPILLLAVVGLLQFVGCEALYGVNPVPYPTDDPTFEPPPGTYSGPISLVLTDSTPDASIYYTLDGTDPATTPGGSTHPYDPANPIQLSSGTVVSAIALAPGDSDSSIIRGTYNFAPIVFHQYKDEFLGGGVSAATVATPAFDNPVSAGSLMVLWIWYNANGQSVQVESVIDSDMNMNYTRAVGPTSSAGVPGFQQEIWYGLVAVGGPNFTVAANLSTAITGDKAITGHEFIGADQVAPFIQAASNTGNTANAVCGPIPATANGLIFAAAIYPGGGGPGTGFTQMSGLTGNVSEYEIPTASGPAAANFANTPQGWIAQMATFK